MKWDSFATHHYLGAPWRASLPQHGKSANSNASPTVCLDADFPKPFLWENVLYQRTQLFYSGT